MESITTTSRALSAAVMETHTSRDVPQEPRTRVLTTTPTEAATPSRIFAESIWLTQDMAHQTFSTNQVFGQIHQILLLHILLLQIYQY